MDHAELKRLCEVQMREHLGHTMNKTTGLCYNETCNIARATLALLDARRWRSLETEPPTEETPCLFRQGTVVGFGEWMPGIGPSVQAWWDPEQVDPEEPTHWQPLPAPPEGT